MIQSSPASIEQKSPIDANSRFSCNECRRRRTKCSREIPECLICKKYRRHCLYEKHSKTPLTRKHLTEVEEELTLAKELIKNYLPDVELSNVLQKLRNGYSVDDLNLLKPHKRPRIEEDDIRPPREVPFTPQINFLPMEDSTETVDFQIPQLIPSTVEAEFRPRRRQQLRDDISPKASYNWDERKQGDAEASSIGGMATTESNSYLGAASSAAVINLVGGGSFLFDKPTSSQATSSVHSASSKDVTRSKLEYYINQYFETYHISYPIVHKAMFMAQFNQIVSVPLGWDSLLYIVASIGAFMLAESPSENDDLKLFAIAKSKLAIEDLETGNLTLVQTLSLMSNYLQKRDRPNSGYNYLGLAVRMALGLGLHRHIEDDEESLFNQEMKRRIWWCLYIFDCGQTITYGRPLGIPCSGIDARLPLNILDNELTALSSKLPDEHDGATIYTSVRLQSLFHLLSNSIYERIITDPFPTSTLLLQWDEKYLERWKRLVPDHFKEDAIVPMSFKLAHAVLEWRFRNFRIIMYRTFLLKNAIVNSKMSESASDSKAADICLQECSATIRSMDNYWNVKPKYNRMDAWYSLYFLIPAVLMPLVCLRNDPISINAEEWRTSIAIANQIIERIIRICVCPAANKILTLIETLGGGYLALNVQNEGIDFPTNGTDESPFSQLMQLHTVLWPGSFDIEQQFLQN